MSYFGPYPWWDEKTVKFQKETSDFLDTLVEEEMKTRWTREFPFEIMEKIGKTGMTGAAIPEEYGGLGLGATGSCIVAEETWKRFPGIGRLVVGNFNGGLRQVYEHGNEEQKKRLLPDIAGGELGAVAITEITAGTDASGMTVVAENKGDHYVINGRKRFIVGAGVANRYFIYAQTSFDPAVIKKHKHLTAFMIHKGIEGFHSERINEILGFENIQNGSLYLKDVKVPIADRIGEEGEGWAILMGGLNFERTNIAGQLSGLHRGILQYVFDYCERRVQFGKATLDIPENQFKIANIIMRAKVLRDSVFVTAYKWDLGLNVTIDASAVKGLGARLALESGNDATQLLGGDGINRFYPIMNYFELGKADHIAGGTVEACQLTVYGQAKKFMGEDAVMPRRVLDPETRVPVPTYKPISAAEKKSADAAGVLDLLAENYMINPGLHMTPGDIMKYIDADEEKTIAIIEELVAAGDAKVVRKRDKITLVSASYPGLEKAKPREWYEWYPEFVKKDPRRTF